MAASSSSSSRYPHHPVASANETSPFGNLSAKEFYAHHKVTHATSSFVNPQNLRIFTQWWVPESLGENSREPLGIVCMIHGFTGESSWFLQLTAVHFAKQGFAVCALDHQGHGFSDGLYAHVPDINPVVDDCVSFFNSFRQRYSPSVPAFLYAESLGGAIALLIHLRGEKYDGVVLNGAMCGISNKFKPQWPLEHFLSVVAKLVPTWQVVPTKGSIPQVSFKVEWKRKLAVASPRRKQTRPRAATALELLRVCREVQDNFNNITIPMLIVHGGEDVICDPASVEDLYKNVKSEDKTLKIHPGLWHQLVGESDEDVDTIFAEVLDWLIARAQQAKAKESIQETSST